jgi:hypothetical protein
MNVRDNVLARAVWFTVLVVMCFLSSCVNAANSPARGLTIDYLDRLKSGALRSAFDLLETPNSPTLGFAFFEAFHTSHPLVDYKLQQELPNGVLAQIRYQDFRQSEAITLTHGRLSVPTDSVHLQTQGGPAPQLTVDGIPAAMASSIVDITSENPFGAISGTYRRHEYTVPVFRGPHEFGVESGPATREETVGISSDPLRVIKGSGRTLSDTSAVLVTLRPSEVAVTQAQGMAEGWRHRCGASCRIPSCQGGPERAVRPSTIRLDRWELLDPSPSPFAAYRAPPRGGWTMIGRARLSANNLVFAFEFRPVGQSRLALACVEK